MNQFKVLLIFNFIACFISIYTHKCIHEEISQKFPVQFLNNDKQEEFLNLINIQSGFDQNKSLPIRVHFDTQALKTQVRDKIQLQFFKQRDFLINKVIPTAVQFFQSRLTVNRVPFFIDQLKGQTCLEYKIPQQFEAPEADIYIFATAKYESNQSYVAYAASCMLHPDNSRPITGLVNFNLAYLKISNKEFNDFTMTVLHEIMHVLGFSPTLYEHFQDSQGKKIGLNKVKKTFTDMKNQRVTGLVTPNLVQFAQNYWGCSSIEYVPLENEGGQGSMGAHFERAVLFNEVMTASTIKDAVFSGFTFSLLKDSGWYGIDETHFENFYVGKNMGCDWLKACHSPQNQPYFCKLQGKEGCYFDYSSIGVCDDFFLNVDQCRMVHPYPNMDCNDQNITKETKISFDVNKTSRGVNSKCFFSNISKNGYNQFDLRPACYDSFCSSDKKQITISVKTISKVCTKDNQVLDFTGSDFKGIIKCPVISHFCKDNINQCENYCNGRGYCKDGSCECLQGFTGQSCDQKTS